MGVSVLIAALLLAGTAAQPAALEEPVAVPQARLLPDTPLPAAPSDAAPVLALPVAPNAAPPEAAAETPAPEAPLVESDAGLEEDEIVVRARKKREAVREDPLQEINAASFAVVQTVDRAFVAPAASVYEKVLPSPVRSGIRNFFNNLFEPINFVNDVLQLKPGRAVKTFGRFAINSTIGAVGLFDVAKRKPFKLPRRRNGFANTLGYYGVKPGAFLFLPVVGPTTVRDLIGLGLDRLLLPVAIGTPFNKPYYAIPAGIISSLDDRVEFDAQLQKMRDAPDPYAASRANYMQRRQAEIEALHGNGPAAAVPPPMSDAEIKKIVQSATEDAARATAPRSDPSAVPVETEAPQAPSIPEAPIAPVRPELQPQN